MPDVSVEDLRDFSKLSFDEKKNFARGLSPEDRAKWKGAAEAHKEMSTGFPYPGSNAAASRAQPVYQGTNDAGPVVNALASAHDAVASIPDAVLGPMKFGPEGETFTQGIVKNLHHAAGATPYLAAAEAGGLAAGPPGAIAAPLGLMGAQALSGLYDYATGDATGDEAVSRLNPFSGVAKVAGDIHQGYKEDGLGGGFDALARDAHEGDLLDAAMGLDMARGAVNTARPGALPYIGGEAAPTVAKRDGSVSSPAPTSINTPVPEPTAATGMPAATDPYYYPRGPVSEMFKSPSSLYPGARPEAGAPPIEPLPVINQAPPGWQGPVRKMAGRGATVAGALEDLGYQEPGAPSTGSVIEGPTSGLGGTGSAVNYLQQAGREDLGSPQRPITQVAGSSSGAWPPYDPTGGVPSAETPLPDPNQVAPGVWRPGTAPDPIGGRPPPPRSTRVPEPGDWDYSPPASVPLPGASGEPAVTGPPPAPEMPVGPESELPTRLLPGADVPRPKARAPQEGAAQEADLEAIKAEAQERVARAMGSGKKRR